MKKFISIVVLSMCALAVVSTKQALGHGTYTPPDNSMLRSFAPRAVADPGGFVNYETPHVHPLDISPDGTQLAVVNTPDGHVEIFSIDAGTGDLTHAESIKVGMGPVTARWRTATELWVINQLSDSISVIDMTTSTVVRTIVTYKIQLVGETNPNGDEPADVVFATYQAKPFAFVSCSRTDIIQLYDISGDLSSAVPYALYDEVYLQGEDPRSLATDGTNIYAAIFESGNSTTLIAGEDTSTTTFPPNDAALNKNNHPDHPYYINGSTQLGNNGAINAINPIPNDGTLGPFTVAGGLGAYEAHGESILVSDLLLPVSVGTPPTTSIIVRKYLVDVDSYVWKDGNGADWTAYITGAYATESGRVTGWDMLDNDIAILDLSNPVPSDMASAYATRQMNICMALNINPSNGNIYMVGTDATNEVRFEPEMNGTFVRVMLSITDSSGAQVDLIDLNKAHLDTAQGGAGLAYSDETVFQADRDNSIGDPRGVAFSSDGGTVYITGMGSNNVIALNTTNNSRYSLGHTIEVGQGPTGIAHHGTKNRLYVVNKFAASVNVIDTTTPGGETVIDTLAFHDPTPDFVNVGRVHFYGTHENSGLGQVACASCHIDGRMDRLAWDLGNPAGITDVPNQLPNPLDAFFANIRGFGDGLITGSTGTNPNDAINTLINSSEADFGKYHPMKGPMTTQTLQDIIGKEPHHWRGDKDGIEEFAGAFNGLQGDDAPLSPTKMQEFEDFLATIHFPPNPFRPVDNTLPGGPTADGGADNLNLDMTGFLTAPPPSNANLSSPGTPMEVAVPSGGDAWNGFTLYVDESADNSFRCVDCHTLPIGAGSTHYMAGGTVPFSGFLEIPPGVNGEAHQMVVDLDGTGQPHIKIPQTRNQIDKGGFFLNQLVDGTGASIVSRAGFGVLHDGSIDGLVRFLSEPAFSDINLVGAGSDQNVADIVSFTLAIGGADFDYLKTLSGAPADMNNPSLPIPPAAVDKSAHAGVGHSISISAAPTTSSAEENTIYAMTRRANEDVLDLIVSGSKSAEHRGWVHSSGVDAAAVFQSDRNGETVDLPTLLSYAGTSGTEMTFLMVPTVEGPRRGIDRDDDTVYDGDETDYNTDSGNPNDHKWAEDGYPGTQSGTSIEPYATFDSALGALSATSGKSAVLHLKPGTYSSTATILDTPMWLMQEGVGTVTID